MFKILLLICGMIPVFTDSRCTYIKPKHPTCASSVQYELMMASKDPHETFQSVLDLFLEKKQSVHRFEFKYPIGNAHEAHLFFKVMLINAQEAHRFVPVFADCQFLEPKHLGFSRKAEMRYGPSLWEHVLIDWKSQSILVIQEKRHLFSGKCMEGCFATYYTIKIEHGKHYFCGICLLAEPLNRQDVIKTEMVFLETYHNMMNFMASGHVDFTFESLQQY